jgi:predicted RNA-binding protein with PUA-like domain
MTLNYWLMKSEPSEFSITDSKKCCCFEKACAFQFSR